MLTTSKSRSGDKPKLSARLELSPLSITRMLWKQRFVVAGAWIVLSALALIGIRRLRPVYMAEALILVDSQKIPEQYVTSAVSNDVSDRLATITQEIMSTSRLLKVIETFDLYKQERRTKLQEEIVEQMRQDISTKVERGWAGDRPGAFRVRYQGPNPAIVAQVANQLANLYVQENFRTRETQAAGTAEFLVSQLDQAKKKLDDLEARVSDFKRAHSGSLPEQQDSLLATIGNLQVQLQGAQDAINRAQQNKVMLETTLAAAESSESVMERGLQSQAAGDRPESPDSPESSNAGRRTPRRSELLEQQLEQLKLRYAEGHPDVQRMRTEIAQAKKREEEEARAAAVTLSATQRGKGAAPEVQSRELMQEKERVAGLRTQLANAKREIEFRSAEQDRLVKQMAVYQSRIDNLPQVEQQMASLTRDYEISKSNYKSLLDKQISAGMANDMERRKQGERFTVIDPARVPERPIKPNRLALTLIGTGVSLLLGFALGLALETRRNAILGEWELPPDLVILGRVPPIAMPAPLRQGSQTAKAVLISTAILTKAVVGSLVHFGGPR